MSIAIIKQINPVYMYCSLLHFFFFLTVESIVKNVILCSWASHELTLMWTTLYSFSYFQIILIDVRESSSINCRLSQNKNVFHIYLTDQQLKFNLLFCLSGVNLIWVLCSFIHFSFFTELQSDVFIHFLYLFYPFESYRVLEPVPIGAFPSLSSCQKKYIMDYR